MGTQNELHDLVDKVMTSLLPLATNRNNSFINEITSELEVHADRDQVAMVFGNLLQRAVGLTTNGCIRVSAKSYFDKILLDVKETSNLPFTEVADSMEPIQLLAQQLGGCISVINNPMSGTSVALSFHNGVRAA